MHDGFICMVHAVKKNVYYHGQGSNGACVFSYSCGHCSMPVDDKDRFCRWCGAKFIDYDSKIVEEKRL